MSKRILVIGSANIDFVLKTAYIPERGETLISDGDYSFVSGGKGANTAVAASKLGSDVVFCARVGDDAYGDRLKRIYQEYKIDLRHVRTDKVEQTGLAVVMLESNGSNRIIVYPGANKKLNESDIEHAFTSYPDVVMAQFENGEDIAVLASQLAEKDDIPFILDGGGARSSFDMSRIKKAEIFSPNEVETTILTGIRPDSLEDCLRACISICSKSEIKYVVLKLGARGCYVYDGKYCDIIAPFNVQALDTTAAGDAFTAALTIEYMKNKNIIAAAKYANAVGALTVTKIGALTSLPSNDEVLAFLSQN